MTETENQAIEHPQLEEEVSPLQRLKRRITTPILDFFDADRSGKTDMLGKVFLLVPAFASTLIIVLILGFLWFESTPIMTDPAGGPGIIIGPTWDPNRDLYGDCHWDCSSSRYRWSSVPI